MAFFQGQYEITAKKQLTQDIFSFTVNCAQIAQTACAGQFVNIKIPGFPLRRPISISNIDRKDGKLTFVFQIRGEGTKVLAGFSEGNMLDIMGPLGHGFDVQNPREKVIFVGGGIGVPPLLEAAKNYGINATVILGFRNAQQVILRDEFLKNMNRLYLATDDGSYCEKGFVTDILVRTLNHCEEKDLPKTIFACGPEIMLQKVADIAKKRDIRCQVSLEARMGCGVGACLVCACRTRTQHTEAYSHVCKDGPVFDSEEVVFRG